MANIDFKKDAPMVIIAVIVLICSMAFAFKQGTPLDPIFGMKLAYGDLPYPAELNLDNTTYNGTKASKGLTDNTTKLKQIFYGSYGSKSATNVCSQFGNCTLMNTAKGQPKIYNSKGTPFCINPNVINVMNLKNGDLCPADDTCFGNCNILYDVMTKPNITENSGMKGVDKIFDFIDSNTTSTQNKDTNNDVIKQQYKNQIKYLLCQIGKQNIYDYNIGGTYNVPIYLTWDGISQMNGWKGDHREPALGFYILSLLVVLFMAYKIIKPMFTSGNKIFEMLFIGSTLQGLSGMDTKTKKASILVQFIVSFLIYWVVCIYFVNTLITTKEVGSVDPPGWLSDSFNHGVGSYLKVYPVVFALVFWIVLSGFSWFICGKDNKTWWVNGLFTVIVGGVIAYMFAIIINTRLGAVNQPTITKSSGNAIDWKDDDTPGVNPIEVANTNSIVKIFPIIWAVLAGGSLIIILVWRGLSKKFGSNNTSSVKPVVKPVVKPNNLIKNSQINVLNLNVTVKPANMYNNNNTKSCGGMNNETKYKGGLLISTVLMVTYIGIFSSNILLCILAPSPFIVVMVLQRLIITNLIPSSDDDDWRTNWNFILFPMLNYIIRKIYDVGDDVMLGESNNKIFGSFSKGNKGTNSKKVYTLEERNKINKAISEVETKLTKASKGSLTMLDRQNGYLDTSMNSNINKLTALQQIGGGDPSNNDRRKHIKSLLDILYILKDQQRPIDRLSNTKLDAFKKKLDDIKGIKYWRIKKFDNLKIIINNLIDRINDKLESA